MTTVSALEAAVAALPANFTHTIEEEAEEGSQTPSPLHSTSRPTSAASNASATKPTPVFAPRPVRLPPPVVYRPIPIRRPVLVVDESQSQSSTPPPSESVGSSLRAASASPGKSLGSRPRRSSSAASRTEGPWNLKSMVVTGQGFQGSDTEVQLNVNENAGEEGKDDADPVPVQIYRFVDLILILISVLIAFCSPSKDVLEELYKIIRNTNKTTMPYPGSIPRTPSASSVSQFPFNPLHRRQLSGTSEGARTPPTRSDGSEIRIPFRKLNIHISMQFIR